MNKCLHSLCLSLSSLSIPSHFLSSQSLLSFLLQSPHCSTFLSPFQKRQNNLITERKEPELALTADAHSTTHPHIIAGQTHKDPMNSHEKINAVFFHVIPFLVVM